MAKASRAGLWNSSQPFVEKGVNSAMVLTIQARQWVNDIYQAVLSPNSELQQAQNKITALEEILPITQANSTANSHLDGTVAGCEAAIEELVSDFNNLLSTLRGD